MGALAHVLEANGLATVAIFPTDDIPTRMRPPRALVARFPLGRPLGRPNDPPFQHGVLRAALDLLASPSGPVVGTFPEVITDEAAEALSCPLPPRHDPSLPPPVDEALALRAAVGRATGHGLRAPDAEDVAAALAAFDRIANGVAVAEAGLDGDVRAAARTVLTYYEMAALGLSDHVPGARQAETWYAQHTEAGATMRRARDELRRQGAERPVWYYLLPSTQA